MCQIMQIHTSFTNIYNSAHMTEMQNINNEILMDKNKLISFCGYE